MLVDLPAVVEGRIKIKGSNSCAPLLFDEVDELKKNRVLSSYLSSIKSNQD
jgi:hypothetical protein